MGRVRRMTTAALVLLLVAAGLSGCAAEPLTISAAPAPMFPAFNRNVPDYVIRCDPARRTKLSINAQAGITVSVDGGAARSGNYAAWIRTSVGRRFTFAVNQDGRTTTHSVRCIPQDFPVWAVDRRSDPQSAFFATLPFDFANPGSYPIIFDDNGVPIWWAPKTTGLYATVLPNGNPMWAEGGVLAEHRLDGSLVRTFEGAGSPVDFHDLLIRPNGNHVLVTIIAKPGVDLRSWGGPANATILDHEIQEISPAGEVVWSWLASDHIPVAETTAYFRAAELAEPGGPFSDFYDPYHYNSIEPDGDGFIISMRHDDAVYRINKATGAIDWKLGGTPRAESLAFVNDPVAGSQGAFAGQHDARLQPDGTLTMFDNGTGRNRAPRVVRYRLDLPNRRAIFLAQYVNAGVPASGCCGSGRFTPGGNVVTGWGGNGDDVPDITEATPRNHRVLALWFPNETIYRATPVPEGLLTREALRAGMDAQYR